MAYSVVTPACLIDSGSDDSFMDQNIPLQLGIDILPLDSPLEAKALNGLLLARVVNKTAPVTLLLSSNHQEVISFHIIDCPNTLLVLGYPWLTTHNSHIDWVTCQITSWSTFCHANCLHSALAPATTELQSLPEPPDLSTVPNVHHNLATVFFKHSALSLPPHHPYDCAINLQPGAPLPSSGLYNLSRPEHEAMEKNI